MDVVVSARIRHLGLIDVKNLAERARDPRLGYELGRMHMCGAINARQLEAGNRFGQDMARYYGLSGVQFPSPRAQNLFAVRGETGESEDAIKAAQRARSIKNALHGLLLGVGDIETGYKALRYATAVCVLDQSLGKSVQALAILRRGLNRLAWHYGLTDLTKSAKQNICGRV